VCLCVINSGSDWTGLLNNVHILSLFVVSVVECVFV